MTLDQLAVLSLDQVAPSTLDQIAGAISAVPFKPGISDGGNLANCGILSGGKL
jgi:hypothetical protein